MITCPSLSPKITIECRFKTAVKKLKREILALYYALEDPNIGILPRALAVLTVAYALSPMDLIPDFIPILGLIDDLIILPGMIILTIKFIPVEVIERARKRADREPLRISSNWFMGAVFFLMWDFLLGWIVLRVCQRVVKQPWVVGHAWWLTGGIVGVVVLIEIAWMIFMIRKERKEQQARVSDSSNLTQGLLAENGGLREEP